MRWKRYAVILLGMLGVLLIGTGCQKKEEKVVDSRFQDSENYLHLSTMTESEDGIYYISRGSERDLIKYLDKKTLKTTVLCQKFNCKHDSEECQAYIDEDIYVGCMVYANGYLYRFDKLMTKDGLILYRFEADGSGKKEIHVFPNESTPPNGGGLYQGKFYLSLSVDKEDEAGSGKSAEGTRLISYDLETGELIDIAGKGDILYRYFHPCGISNGKLYYVETSTEEIEDYQVYTYDINTGEIQESGTWDSINFQEIANDQMYIAYKDQKKLEVQSLETMDRRTILEWEEDLTVFYLMGPYVTLVQIKDENGKIVGSMEEWYQLNREEKESAVSYKWYDLEREEYLFDEYQSDEDMYIRTKFGDSYWLVKGEKEYFYEPESKTWTELKNVWE